MNLAPIVFFVYNRPFHTIQSLKYLNFYSYSSSNETISDLSVMPTSDTPRYSVHLFNSLIDRVANAVLLQSGGKRDGGRRFSTGLVRNGR